MIEVHVRAKAKKDLKDIWLYTFGEFGELQADKYHDALSQAFQTMSKNPSIGVPCDFIRLGYRQFHINQHCIFYRLGKDKIQVVRVLHQSMQFKKHLT